MNVISKTYDRIASWAQQNSDKLATRLLVLMIAYSAIRSLVSAASKPLWSDELVTLCVARQPNISSMWRALQSAVDVNPPPFYLFEHFFGTLVPDEHIAFRLLSILALCCAILCIFLFVRKRSSSSCALLCAAIPLISVLYDVYAVEARGYSVVIALTTIAAVSYQRIEDTQWWTILMGLSLTAAETVHYYAIFAVIPFAFAETARVVTERQLRPAVWLALLSSLVPLTIFWPLLWGYKTYYGTHFWGQLSLLDLTNVYGWFFNLSTPVGIGIAIVAVLGSLGAILRRSLQDLPSDRTTGTPFHEYVLVLGFLILPCIIFAAIKIFHGGLVNRYMLLGLIGFPLVAGCILPLLDRKVVLLFAAFLLSVLATQEAKFFLQQKRHFGRVMSPAETVEQVINANGCRDLPVVISDGLVYMQLVHYASPEWADRLYTIVDPTEAIIYAGSDSVEKNLLVLRPYIPLQLYEFHDFVAKHPRFLLYSTETTQWNWWPRRLLDDGYLLRVMAIHENVRLYFVSDNPLGRRSKTEEPGMQNCAPL